MLKSFSPQFERNKNDFSGSKSSPILFSFLSFFTPNLIVENHLLSPFNPFSSPFPLLSAFVWQPINLIGPFTPFTNHKYGPKRKIQENIMYVPLSFSFACYPPNEWLDSSGRWIFNLFIFYSVNNIIFIRQKYYFDPYVFRQLI